MYWEWIHFKLNTVLTLCRCWIVHNVTVYLWQSSLEFQNLLQSQIPFHKESILFCYPETSLWVHQNMCNKLFISVLVKDIRLTKGQNVVFRSEDCNITNFFQQYQTTSKISVIKDLYFTAQNLNLQTKQEKLVKLRTKWYRNALHVDDNNLLLSFKNETTFKTEWFTFLLLYKAKNHSERPRKAVKAVCVF
jgi:hypothetical protein